MPDVNHSEFTGKTFIDGTGTNSTYSGHATSVGRYFYGNRLSLATGAELITCFDADDWINNETGLNSGGDPLLQPFAVQNHSWIGNGAPINVVTLALERVDFMINRDNLNLVAGTNNGGNSNTPQLLAPGYNSITVGRSDGNHANTDTTFYGAGRMKPEIVAPATSTSLATPMVAGAAAILRDAATGYQAAEKAKSSRRCCLPEQRKKSFPIGPIRSFARSI